MVANRYAHARWDPKERCFTHFDGAIRAYNVGEYGERLRTDIKKYPGKSASYYPGTEEAHTNPTRQRGECLRALAGASG